MNLFLQSTYFPIEQSTFNQIQILKQYLNNEGNKAILKIPGVLCFSTIKHL